MSGETALKNIYSILLDMQIPGLSETMKKLGSFDSAFNWWIDNQIKNILDIDSLNEELNETVDTVGQHAIAYRLYKQVLQANGVDPHPAVADGKTNNYCNGQK